MSTEFAPKNNRRFIKRPDDSAMKSEIEALRKEIQQLDASDSELTSTLNKTTTDPKVNEKRKQLLAQLKEIIAKQGQIKSERKVLLDQIKQIDSGIKRKISELEAQTSKNNFKNAAEIDARVNYLDSLIDEGSLKLADERRYVKEMSQLRKLRKDFGQIEQQQASIDKDKAKIAQIKQELNQIQNKQVQQQFETIQKELDEINAGNKTVTDKRNSLFEKRKAVRKQKDEKYDRIRKLRSEFEAELTKFKKTLEEERKKREEETKEQRAKERQERRKANAEKRLAEASVPAFTTEINQIHGLLSYFDPSYVRPAAKTGLAALTSKATNTNTTVRKVEMPEDAVIIKKEQESFFEGTKGKKKGKKSSGKAKAFTVDPEVLVTLTELSIPLPTKSEDVAGTISVLKETLEALEAKQDEQTKTNIERAKAEIAKIEAEAKDDDDEEDDVDEE